MLAALDTTSEAVAPAQSALHVGRIVLNDFRNYGELSLDVEGGPVVLTGLNGAGKTNLLEALSFLSPGRGLRRAALRNVDRKGGGAWSVWVRILAGDTVREIGTGRAPDSERRIVRIDGQGRRSQGDLADIMGVVWLTPAMDRLFLGSASDRRRFLDRLVFATHPRHAHAVGRFDQALRERSRLLRNGPADPDWLAAIERRAAAAGVEVAAGRCQALVDLGGALRAGSGPFPRPRLAVEGDVEGWIGEMPALAAEERLALALQGGRERDSLTGGAAIGPHRSDLVVIDDMTGEPAGATSTGRQKALLISIVLAEARLAAQSTGHAPILLLDEIAAHLDARRRADLFAELTLLGGQVWLTGTDKDIFAPLDGVAQFFSISNAVIRGHDRHTPPRA